MKVKEEMWMHAAARNIALTTAAATPYRRKRAAGGVRVAVFAITCGPALLIVGAIVARAFN